MLEQIFYGLNVASLDWTGSQGDEGRHVGRSLVEDSDRFSETCNDEKHSWKTEKAT